MRQWQSGPDRSVVWTKVVKYGVGRYLPHHDARRGATRKVHCCLGEGCLVVTIRFQIGDVVGDALTD